MEEHGEEELFPASPEHSGKISFLRFPQMRVIVSRERQRAGMRRNVDEMPEFSLCQRGGSPAVRLQAPEVEMAGGDAEFRPWETLCSRHSLLHGTAAGDPASDASPSVCSSGHCLAGRVRLVLFPRRRPRSKTASGQSRRTLSTETSSPQRIFPRPVANDGTSSPDTPLHFPNSGLY